MAKVIWSPAALRDIQRWYRFLAEKSQDAARSAIRTIRHGMKTLATQPEIGRPVEEMEPEFREWPIDFGDSGYVAMYRYDGKTAVILAVRHRRELDY